jgi:hypothetical protein
LQVLEIYIVGFGNAVKRLAGLNMVVYSLTNMVLTRQVFDTLASTKKEAPQKKYDE